MTNTHAAPPHPRRLVVTGSGSGIGRATALLAARTGWSVAGLDLTGPERPATRDGVRTVRCDVTDETSVEAAFAAADDLWEGMAPTAVVHCAGVYRFKPAVRTTAADWDAVLGINARGSLLVAAAAGRRMTAAPGPGSVVLLSSIGAVRGDAGEPSAAYSASKGAVVSLARQLAVEWGPDEVRCNAVLPGVIDTPMTTVTQNPDAFREVVRRIPAGRTGTAEEVARLCLFLASDAASFVNGAAVPADGGQSAV